MSETRLKELGDQILAAVAGNQLQSEIAVTALECIHQMFVTSNAHTGYEDDEQRNGSSHLCDDGRQRWDIMGGDELGPPAMFGSGGDPVLMARVSLMPFLFHDGNPTNIQGEYVRPTPWQDQPLHSTR